MNEFAQEKYITEFRKSWKAEVGYHALSNIVSVGFRYDYFSMKFINPKSDEWVRAIQLETVLILN